MITQVQRISREASVKDADFLALRLLNKRGRLRLSPEPIELDVLPGRGPLFAVANSKGWFVAAIVDSNSKCSLILSPLSELHPTFSSSPSDSGEILLKPQRTVPLPGVPNTLVFAHNDTRLLVELGEGSIRVYDTAKLFSEGADVNALHSFPGGGEASKEMLPNPGDASELVAVLRRPLEGSDILLVEILDVQNMSSLGGWRSAGTSNTMPTASERTIIVLPFNLLITSPVSWSPKGKQLAIGLESGDIVTFNPTPTSAIRSFIPCPPVANNLSVISTVWLSNPEFHTIYAAPGNLTTDAAQTHVVLSFDHKTNTVGDVTLNTPYMPYPALRPPGSFTVVLRSWEPARFLIFVGDSSSSDIGLIGSLAEPGVPPLQTWYNLDLEETSTPSVPLDKEMFDTVLLGLALDLTASESVSYTAPSGEEVDVPPPPIMYAYSNDGTLSGWHIINTKGSAYPGMVVSSAGSIPSTTPAADSTPTVISSSLAPSMSSSSIPEEPMTTDTDKDAMTTDTDTGFGGLSLGGGSTEPRAGFGTNTMFGQPAPVSSSSSLSAFGSSPLKPAVGFGAFANQGPSPFGAFTPKPPGETTAIPTPTQTTSPSFGQTGFGKAASGQGAFGQAASGPGAFGQGASGQSAFGKPSFGQPAFGQSGFGQPSFGQPAFGKSAFGAVSSSPTLSTPSSSGGGFAAFAQAGPTGFGGIAQNAPSANAKPVWALLDSSTESKANGQPSSVFGGGSVGISPIVSDGASVTLPSTTPATSPVQAKTPSSGGAFGNLTTSTVGFGKIGAGFGAFGSSTNISSPFFQTAKMSEASQPVSVFGAVSPSSVQKGAATPTFGSPSALGKAPSIFGKPSLETSSTTPTTTPMKTGAFSAFSGATSAFGSLAGSGKSFSDLLRETSTTSENPPSVFGKPAAQTSAAAGSGPSQPPVSVFAKLKQDAERLSSQTSEAANLPEEGTSAVSEDEDAEGEEFEETPEDDVGLFLTDSEEESESEEGDIYATESPPRSPTGPTKPSLPTAAQEPSVVAPVETPSDVAAPSSPAPTLTSEQGPAERALEASNIPFESPTGNEPPAPSAIPTSDYVEKGESPAAPELTKTPTGPPAKTAPGDFAGRPSSAPPVLTPSPSLFSGLGVGRPSTRPARSSPLASQPITNETEGIEQSPAAKGKPPEPPVQPSPPPVLSAFAAPSAPKPRVQTPPPLSALGATPLPSATPFSLAPRTSPAPAPQVSTLFGGEPTPPAAASPVTSTPTFGGTGVLGGPAVFKAKPPPVAADNSLAEGMQSECAHLYVTLAKELEDVRPPRPTHRRDTHTHLQLRSLALEASARKELLGRAGNGSRSRADLGDPTKWVVGDATQFAQIMKSVEKDIAVFETEKATYIGGICDLESNMLKGVEHNDYHCIHIIIRFLSATTRKEEVIRFTKASQDAEFAKMLKARTLGPEHLETQSQLRRDIRTIRGRIQQLEDHIQASKKKLNSMKSGKAAFRPPSLDTVNRTYRNIDLAIEQQEDEVASLASRMVKLELKGAQTLLPERDKRLPDNNRASKITPSVVVSTAAALNAEVAAQKLKRALLRSRKEPLLNTQAVSAPQVPKLGETPRKTIKAEPTTPSLFTSPSSGLAWTPPSAGQPEWSLPPFEPDNFSPTPLSNSRHRSPGNKLHAKPIQLKKAPRPLHLPRV
ncbi:hypothetical protein A0H81_07501 [Grifola frondosa]|uniref:Nucleoporin Nup159/Nup146 N-terminal domain-containing protein n=1 Tax=Grifola frondosa TaxID=5627 RepID=A0A1C7M5Y7_GRIFR|nr:hypothetical protein A0H81_07501 [Grifola frondosa]